jgi:hypothetical protein
MQIISQSKQLDSGSYEEFQACNIHHVSSEPYLLKYGCRNFGVGKTMGVVCDNIFTTIRVAL